MNDSGSFPDFRLSDLRQIVGGARRGRLLPPRHQRAQDKTESRVPGAVFSFAVLTGYCSNGGTCNAVTVIVTF